MNNIQSPVIVTFTRYKSSAPLSKSYWLDGKQIQKQATSTMSAGTAERITIPFAEFPQALSNATEKQAFGYGIHSYDYPDTVKIVISGKEEPAQNIISRTHKFYAYHNSPGVLMLDHDPSEYGQIMSPKELVASLIDIHPEIGQAARIVRSSVSAGVRKIGDPPRTGKGFHIYIPVLNAADIPRYGAVLFDRLWLNEFGFIALSSSGSTLVRSVIDGSVFSPERLDFVGKPIISGTGLELMPTEIIYVKGNLLDTQTLQDLTDDEKITVKRLEAEKKVAIKGGYM
jgi:hypothetical protein